MNAYAVIIIIMILMGIADANADYYSEWQERQEELREERSRQIEEENRRRFETLMILQQQRQIENQERMIRQQQYQSRGRMIDTLQNAFPK